MASIPPYRRIGLEDINLEDPAQAIEQLLYPLNLNFETLSNALSRNVTFSENISATTRQINLTEEQLPIRIAHRLPRQATHLFISQMYETNNRTGTDWSAGGPFPAWYDDGQGNVVITSIAHLTAATQYVMTVLIA